MTDPPRDLRVLLLAAGLVVPDGADSDSFDRADAIEYRFEPQRTVAMLAEKVEALHALDSGACTGVGDLASITMRSVADGATRATAAAPDAPLDEAYAHMSRAALLEVLEAGLERLGEPPDAELVLTHGAPALDALLCSGGTAVGFTNWDAVALADRHRDLAHVASSLSAAMGPMMVAEFFEYYRPRPDLARLDWWLLAGQLLGPSGTGEGPGGSQRAARDCR